MAQFSQGLGFNLPNPFPSDVELFAHLFQGAGPAVLNAKAELQHFLLPGREGGEHIHQLFLQQGKGCGLGGLGSVLVRNKVAQMGILLLSDGGFQADRLLGNFQNLPHLVHRHVHLLGNLLW